ncbi:O-methyltransferase [Sphingosinicella sp.]|uniref:O-methyltransferase n=1 Tax=Sphingosinicella sp. TaxID=1917971 RepID=UPI002602FCED|nr:O-methyltransferase [Sphingosinicella sp.]
MSVASAEVDAWIADRLIGGDPALDKALARNAAEGLPAIDVSAAQGKLLHVLARSIGAWRILEVGTLGGYSTIWLARALPDHGVLVMLEIDPHHAEVARANLDAAGIGDKVEIRVGPAVETLSRMETESEGPFDLVFIDADKPNNVAYLKAALALARPGALIIVDNVVREGRVTDASSTDAAILGTRALFDVVAAEPRLTATAIQTVGAKGWDGFMIAVVNDE